MDPLFTLPTQASPPFGRATNFELKKVLLETPLNPNVQTGRHVFSFQNTSAEWWVPSKSYLRLRLAYERMDGTGMSAQPPCLQDMIAPVMNPCAHLFQRIEYYIDGNRVSDIQDHIAQIDTLKYRTTRSTSHLDTFGEVSNWMQPEFKLRQQRISTGRRVGAFPLLSNQGPTPGVVDGTGSVFGPNDPRQQLGANYVGASASGLLNTAERIQYEADSLLPQLIWDPQNFPNDISQSCPDHRPLGSAFEPTRANTVQSIPVLVAAGGLTKDHYILMFEPRPFASGTAASGFLAAAYDSRSGVVGAPSAESLVDETLEGRAFGVEAHGGYINLPSALGVSAGSLGQWIGGSLIFRNLQAGSILIGTGSQGRSSSACTATITDIYYGPERTAVGKRTDVKLNPDVVAEAKIPDVTVPSVAVRVVGSSFDDDKTNDSEAKSKTAAGSIPAYQAQVVVQPPAAYAELEALLNDPQYILSSTSGSASVTPMGLVLHIPGLTLTEDNSVPDEIRTPQPRAVRNFSRRLKLQSLFGGINASTRLTPDDCRLTLSVVSKDVGQLSADRTPTSVSNQFELCWLPPLGIFSVGHALPPTRHRLEFTVANDFQARMIEFGDLLPWDTADAIARIANPGSSGNDVANKFRVRIVDMAFFAAMVTGPRSDDVNFVLDFAERKMIQYQIPVTQMGQPTAYNFNISPTSTDVTVAFQSTFAGRGVQSLSKFHVPTKSRPFGCETALKRFYVNFNGQNRPREENESILIKPFPSAVVNAPPSQRELNMSRIRIPGNNSALSYTSSTSTGDQIIDHLLTPGDPVETKQFFTQRYVETMLNTSMMFSSGGCESFHTWLERGAYYHWVWPRDGADLSTTFTVFLEFFQAQAQNTPHTKLIQAEEAQQVFQTAVGKDAIPNTVNLCIFDKNLRNFTLTIQNGNVTYCEASNSFTADGVRRPRVA